jgi:hypothetical protein
VEERELVEKMESAEPANYKYSGALGWENGSISSFLNAALSCVEDGEHSQEANWREFAKFLYFGKIYE